MLLCNPHLHIFYQLATSDRVAFRHDSKEAARQPCLISSHDIRNTFICSHKSCFETQIYCFKWMYKVRSQNYLFLGLLLRAAVTGTERHDFYS
jgi:hypothetical protein